MAATFETRASNADDVNYALLGNNKKSQSSCGGKKVWIALAILIFIGAILAAVFITKKVVENNNNSGDAASSSGGDTTSAPTMEPTIESSISPTLEPTSMESTSTSPTTQTTTTTEPSTEPTSEPTTKSPPKNLIIIISDGMGQTYNVAYRRFKNLTRTTIDKHFKGRYSTTPTIPDGITDSAAGATVFACGVQTHNSFLCLDGVGNPRASILAAAKRQGKGTGIVATKSITDATPAAFTAHSLYRHWDEMISKQQVMRKINGENLIDVMFGGGRQYFERWGFFRNSTMWEEYGWNKVTDNTTEFLEELDKIDISEMPYMGLFADSSFPYYLDRLNGDDLFLNDSLEGEKEYPGLLDMSQKAINLLSTKYEDEGFFLMLEASRVDQCGHDNDIVCLLWEMDEFMLTTEWVLEWAANDTETLVVMLSDHETGGLAIGRDGSYYKDDLVKYWNGEQPRDGNVADAWYSFDNAYGIAAPSDVSSFVEHYGAYYWHPQAVANAKHTASWFASKTGSHGEYEDIEDIFYALETMYIGGTPDDNDMNVTLLTEVERNFTRAAMERSSSTRKKAVAALMNARTMTGWTTHGHSSADCAVHAFGPYENEFIGHWQNFELGILMREIFGVEDEWKAELELMEDEFINGSLKICDPTDRPSYVEWKKNVSYPKGNLLYGNYCVEVWMEDR